MVCILKNHGIQISMDGKGRYHDNIFIERLWRTVKYELLYTRTFSNLKEVRQNLTQWFDWYNQVELPPLDGHVMFCLKEKKYGTKLQTSLPGGVSPADGGIGGIRQMPQAII